MPSATTVLFASQVSVRPSVSASTNTSSWPGSGSSRAQVGTLAAAHLGEDGLPEGRQRHRGGLDADLALAAVVAVHEGGEARRDDDRLLADLSELRDAIEPAATRLAALRRDEDDLGALEAAFETFAAAGRDVDKLVAADLDIHLLLLTATHNELYARLDMVIRHALEARNRIQHHPDALWMDPVPDHRAVLDAVRASDPETAEKAMRYALRDSDEDLRSGEPPFEPTGG